MKKLQRAEKLHRTPLCTIVISVFLVIGAFFSASKMVYSAEDSQQMKSDSGGSNPLEKAFQAKRPVVADFGRGTCVPCKMMAPILEDLKQEYKGKAEVVFIDIRDHPGLTREVGIQVIPTQVFYTSSGEEVKRHTGFMDKSGLVQEIEGLLNQ
ncbi:MAG: thioredoxin family protein [Desulfovermiculus sp.]